MRVLLDRTYARRAPHSGTSVYIGSLSDSLVDLGVDVVPVENGHRTERGGGGWGSARNLARDLSWALAELPRQARVAGADLVHHPLPAWSPGVRQVVTVLDLAFERLPQHFDPRFRRYARVAHRAAARRADVVICISRTTAEDVQEIWGVAAERVVVAPLGPGQALPAVPSMDPGHFLYVGDAEPRKDLPTLLDAYARYRAANGDVPELVLAGTAQATQPGTRVVWRPDPAELARLLAGAIALIQPSLYEGFGLTALEGMAAGVPVIAARSPGLSETCGDAALFFDPHDPDSLADALEQVSGRPELRQELAVRGRARAAEFSWARCARTHIEAYSRALEG